MNIEDLFSFFLKWNKLYALLFHNNNHDNQIGNLKCEKAYLPLDKS